jgi:hypothetical protein
MNTPKTKPKPLSEPQWRFVLKTRSAIKNDPRQFFKSHDWRCIVPTNGGRFDSTILSKPSTVEDFYVKAIAAWVPHLLVPNHIPCCPHCKVRRHVDIVKARWINCPKVLYGMSRYKYLDTVLYPCTKCGRRFAGYNKQSMQLDSSLYYGYFTFYLGHGFAVDDELHRFVVESANTASTSSIDKKLQRMAYDAYYDDHQLYTTATGLKKIRPRKKQKTIDQLFLPLQAMGNGELQHLLNVRARCSSHLAKTKLNYNAAAIRCTSDWQFKGMMSEKDNHNVHGARNFLPGLGSTKLRRLMNAGITSCQELLAADPLAHKNIKPLANWQRCVESYYDSLKSIAAGRKLDMEQAQRDYDEALDDLVDYQKENGDVEFPTAPVDETSDAPVSFSDFKDKKGYNGRVLSKFRIDSMVMSVFNHRRSFQELKMQGLTAKLLKIDFNYKLAEKIHVWTKQGCSFSPYKCIVTIQNEDSLTVFWKALKHSESFSEIRDDLVRLRHRLNRNRAAAHAAQVAQR